MKQYINTRGVFSVDRIYRYRLIRSWIGGRGTMAVIGLNPSTADETKDDPTVRRCVGFAKRLGFSSLVMLNAFAFRSTNPKLLYTEHNPIGELNDIHIISAIGTSDLAVAAWGTHGAHLNRGEYIKKFGFELKCWGKTAGGFPRHPLYLPNDASLEIY